MSIDEGLTIVVRKALDSDASDIVALFIEKGSNPYSWSSDKWYHYYRAYPEGEPISIVAEVNGDIVGHYGMLPVTIGDYSAMLGLHAYVAEKYRGLAIISALMRDVDVRCAEMNIDFICGFANKNFALVKKTLFKWNIPFWLGFGNDISSDEINARKKFKFHYTQKWYDWRFGESKNCYISRYKDSSGVVRKQLLKTCSGVAVNAEQLKNCEAWYPRLHYVSDQKNRFCQPFSLKLYNQEIIHEGVFSGENWLIDMGDSDTFQYKSWVADND